MSFWCLHLNSYTTNFWIKKCAKICEKIAIAEGGSSKIHMVFRGVSQKTMSVHKGEGRVKMIEIPSTWFMNDALHRFESSTLSH